MKDMSTENMIEIVHLVIIEKHYQAEVAQLYGVKDKMVCNLMKKVRDNKNYLRDQLKKDQQNNIVKLAVIENA